jgi:tetraacyldisaccharide 4'-kinase
MLFRSNFAKDIENLSQRNNRPLKSWLRHLSWILAPLAGLYWALTAFRNHLFNIEYKKSLAFTPLLISVGNLSVGGTGKSPMIEYLADLLRQDHQLAILSRGYRRQTRGVRLASASDDATTLGDEPYQFYRKLGRNGPHPVVVAVGEDRALAIPEILHQHPEVNTILLDDAFQHRTVKADIQLLLSTFQRPFYQDHILPLGLLRESRQGARRADAVIVTKCPEDLSAQSMQQIRNRIQQYAGIDTPVFFAGIHSLPPVKVTGKQEQLPDPILLISGIARADLFDAYARREYKVTGHIRWGDHHRYTESDRQKIQAKMQESGAKAVLTTEKDMVKLLQPAWSEIPLYYLPIGVRFLKQEADFASFFREKIQSVQKA